MINLLYPYYCMYYDMSAEGEGDNGGGGDSEGGGDEGGGGGDGGGSDPAAGGYEAPQPPTIPLPIDSLLIENPEVPIWIIDEMQRCSDAGGSWDYENSKCFSDETGVKREIPVTTPPVTTTTEVPTYTTVPVDSTYTPKPTQKEIRNIIIKDKTRNINPNGETRSIIIKGEPEATFTLTATTASGCSILEEEVVNFQLPSTGKHQINVKFPKLDAKATSDTFTIETKPAADSALGTFIHADPKIYDTTLDLSYSAEELKEVKEVRNIFPKKDDSNIESITKLYQYKDPTVTFTNTSSQTSPALTVTGSDVTKTGTAKTSTKGTVGYTTSTYTLTIVEDPTDTAGHLYVKSGANFNNNLTNNKAIKKVVRREISGESTPTKTLKLAPGPATSDGTTITSTGMITDSDGNISGDITDGMNVKGCVSYIKTVVTSVGTDNCYLPVSQFKLLDTNNLFKGMVVSGKGVYDYPVTITNVDCDNNIITLSSKHIIRDGTVLTFKHCINTSVRKVDTNADADGRACITINESTVPDRMELSFTEDRTVVHGAMKQSGSGSSSITLTTKVDVIKFGEKDITHTLNLDNFITTTPNAYDQDVLIKKDTATGIYLLKGDLDSNVSSKTATVVGNPRNGAVGSWSTTAKTVTYTPHTGFIGLDSFTFTVSDGTNSSEEKRIFITVN